MQNQGASTTVSLSDLVATGPGTLAGRYMRSFWQPVYVSAELAAAQAKPLQMMGEAFTLYRGASGAAQVVAPYCAHRKTLLSTGWVEGDALRCFYHGWKYGATGRCVEAPAEREGFAETVSIRSYPTVEYAGLIFAYLGDGYPPAFPKYPDLEDEGVLEARDYVRNCNFFNNIENQSDPVHVAFVHRASAFTEGGLIGVPEVSAEETQWGMALKAERKGVGVRVTQLGMPNMLHIKSSPAEPGAGWGDLFAWRIPIDDFTHRSFNVHLHRITGAAADRFRERQAKRSSDEQRSVQELGAAIRRGELTVDEVKGHPQIVGIQDDVAQLGQGAIADRENERLGRSDVGVALIRKLWLRELNALDRGDPLKKWEWNDNVATTVGVANVD
jgi:5,5'-dehydrodivanillate O-demethylase